MSGGLTTGAWDLKGFTHYPDQVKCGAWSDHQGIQGKK